MRQIKIHLPAERAQNFDEQRGGSHAVHVVIAKDDQRFISFARVKQTVNRRGHVRQQKRIGEIFEARLKKIFDAADSLKPRLTQALREQRGNF